MKQQWVEYCDGLEHEVRQVKDEGRMVSGSLLQKIKETLSMELSDEKNKRAMEISDEIRRLPYSQGVNQEPDDLDSIQSLSASNPAVSNQTGKDLFDKLYGGWLGRAAGCLLGKPVEGWRTPELYEFLRLTDNDPVHEYLRGDVSNDVKEQVCRLKANRNWHPFEKQAAFIDHIDCMPEDDDTNYTLLGLKLLEQYGRKFNSDDVAECWLNSLPYYHLCTAERVAYRNLVMRKMPPVSAVFCNPYREWIGAQIRADIFGYVNPGNPHMAAEMAWRDARVSHVKNGIYGEMWAAAMIAAAYTLTDPIAVIRAGLNEIPTESRLANGIREVLTWYGNSMSCNEIMSKIAAQWDEYDDFDWCHVIANAQIVATSLLCGASDFGKTIGLAIRYGFDTDCNAATVGSVLGVMLGAKNIPVSWTSPLNDQMESGVYGFNRVKISDMAHRTLALIQ